MMHSCIYQNYTVFFSRALVPSHWESYMNSWKTNQRNISSVYCITKWHRSCHNTHALPNNTSTCLKIIVPFSQVFFYMTYICLNVSRTVIVKCVCISHDFFALPLKADRYSSPRQTGTCHSWHQHHHAVQGFKSTTFVFRIVQSSWLSACIIWYSQSLIAWA